MAYFSDLSFYDYFRGNPAGTKNVGWLQRGHAFETMVPSEETLELLWTFCTVSVMQARGFHQCNLCPTPSTALSVRSGIQLSLGSAEIRVFSKDDARSELQRGLREAESGGLVMVRRSPVPFTIYAAPNLIYHYVCSHHYKPPDEFLNALRNGPRPPEEEYFECLRKLDLRWRMTSGPSAGL